MPLKAEFRFAFSPAIEFPKQRKVIIYLLLSLARVRRSDGLSLLWLLFLGRLHKPLKTNCHQFSAQPDSGINSNTLLSISLLTILVSKRTDAGSLRQHKPQWGAWNEASLATWSRNPFSSKNYTLKARQNVHVQPLFIFYRPSLELKVSVQ